MIVPEAVLALLVGKSIDAVASVVKEFSGVQIHADKKHSTIAIHDHLRMVTRWASLISFKDLHKSKDLQTSFVDLECRLGTSRYRESPTEKQYVVTDLLLQQGHVVLLGPPGAGKSTTLQRIALAALNTRSGARPTLPILFRLRDLNAGETLLERLISITGIRLDYTSEIRRTFAAAEAQNSPWEVRRRVLTTFLEHSNTYLLIDGLDECEPSLRKTVEKDISALMAHADKCRVFVTCRTADYIVSLPAESYTVLPLTEGQVRKFVIRWLGAQRSDDFMSHLYSSPYKGAELLPITIAHLCAIYERRGEIPAQPRYVYSKIVDLLLEEWDEQRGIPRESRYAEFGVYRKHEFLKRMAFELTRANCRGSFSHAALVKAYLLAYESFGLPQTECTRVAREIESHSGLVLLSEYDQFEFAHKSIQEFLCAEYLLGFLRLDTIPIADFGNELAITTALSTRAEEYLVNIVDRMLSMNSDRVSFARIYLSRLVSELPDFSSSAEVGWGLLIFSDVAEGPSGPIAEKTLGPCPLLRKICTLPTFRSSLRKAIAQSSCSVQGEACHIVPISPTVMSEAQRLYLSVKEKFGVVIPTKVYETVLA